MIDAKTRSLGIHWAACALSAVCFCLLVLSILAPVTETLMLRVSSGLYALLRVFCHQMPSRSLWYANSNFGVCSHCFGILLGAMTMGGAIAFFAPVLLSDRYKWALLFLILGISALPLAVDVLTEWHRQALNAHWVRVLSGFFAGGGFIFWLFAVSRKIGQTFTQCQPIERRQYEIP